MFILHGSGRLVQRECSCSATGSGARLERPRHSSRGAVGASNGSTLPLPPKKERTRKESARREPQEPLTRGLLFCGGSVVPHRAALQAADPPDAPIGRCLPRRR